MTLSLVFVAAGVTKVLAGGGAHSSSENLPSSNRISGSAAPDNRDIKCRVGLKIEDLPCIEGYPFEVATMPNQVPVAPHSGVSQTCKRADPETETITISCRKDKSDGPEESCTCPASFPVAVGDLVSFPEKETFLFVRCCADKPGPEIIVPTK